MTPAENDSRATVVIIKNLSRNVLEHHLQTIFGVYGEVSKVDLPAYGKCAFFVLLFVRL